MKRYEVQLQEQHDVDRGDEDGSVVLETDDLSEARARASSARTGTTSALVRDMRRDRAVRWLVPESAVLVQAPPAPDVIAKLATPTPSFFASDFSDNNNGGKDLSVAYVVQHGPVQLVTLKLYPGANGWTGRNKRILEAAYALSYYFTGDVTSGTWAACASILADIGVDPKTVPLFADMLEFGYSDSAIRSVIAGAHAAGARMFLYVAEGNYPGDLGQDGNMIAHYGLWPSTPKVPFDLFQAWAIQGFGDRSVSFEPFDTFMAKATAGGPPPPPEGGFLDMLSDTQQQQLFDDVEGLKGDMKHVKNVLDGLAAGAKPGSLGPDDPQGPFAQGMDQLQADVAAIKAHLGIA